MEARAAVTAAADNDQHCCANLAMHNHSHNEDNSNMKNVTNKKEQVSALVTYHFSHRSSQHASKQRLQIAI